MKLIFVALAAVAIAVTACSSSGSTGSGADNASPKVMTVHGQFVVSGQDADRMSNAQGSVCYTGGNVPVIGSPTPFDAVKRGAQVVLADAGGKTIGLGKLSAGHTTETVGRVGHPPCAFSFFIPDVTDISKFDRIAVGSHSMQVSVQQLGRPVTISLG